MMNERRILIRILLILLILAWVGISSSCAPTRIIARIKCPPHPEMLPVEVKNKTVSGKDLDNVIDNHLHLWKYIHEIEKLGCTTKK